MHQIAAISHRNPNEIMLRQRQLGVWFRKCRGKCEEVVESVKFLSAYYGGINDRVCFLSKHGRSQHISCYCPIKEPKRLSKFKIEKIIQCALKLSLVDGGSSFHINFQSRKNLTHQGLPSIQHIIGCK